LVNASAIGCEVRPVTLPNRASSSCRDSLRQVRQARQKHELAIGVARSGEGRAQLRFESARFPGQQTAQRRIDVEQRVAGQQVGQQLGLEVRVLGEPFENLVDAAWLLQLFAQRLQRQRTVPGEERYDGPRRARRLEISTAAQRQQPGQHAVRDLRTREQPGDGFVAHIRIGSQKQRHHRPRTIRLQRQWHTDECLPHLGIRARQASLPGRCVLGDQSRGAPRGNHTTKRTQPTIQGQSLRHAFQYAMPHANCQGCARRDVVLARGW
jgi:hypothetical protein